MGPRGSRAVKAGQASRACPCDPVELGSDGVHAGEPLMAHISICFSGLVPVFSF